MQERLVPELQAAGRMCGGKNSVGLDSVVGLGLGFAVKEGIGSVVGLGEELVVGEVVGRILPVEGLLVVVVGGSYKRGWFALEVARREEEHTAAELRKRMI